MHEVEANNFQLKSRNSFLKETKFLTTKEQERTMQWTNQINDKKMDPIKALLPSKQLE